MSWEPDSNAVRLRKQNEDIESLAKNQFYIASGINSRQTSNNMGTKSGSSGWQFPSVGDIIQETTNVFTTIGSVPFILGSLIKLIPSLINEPTPNCATVHVVNGGGLNNEGLVGQRVTFKPQEGKTICLVDRPITSDSTGGNLMLGGNDITIEDYQLVTLRFQKDVIFTDGVGGWVLESSSSGGGSGNGNLHDSVKVATTANITLSGEQTIDGTLTSADRVLVKDQILAYENGVYVTSSGAWTRATDFADGRTQVSGELFPVQEGTVNDNTVYMITNSEPTTVGGLGVGTNFVFADITGGGAGDNLGNHTAVNDLNMSTFDILNPDRLFWQTDVVIQAVDTATPDGTLDRLEYNAGNLGGHDFFVDRPNTTIPRFGITETSIESNVDLNMNGKNIISETGSTTDSGFIRLNNDEIALSSRNSTNTGNFEIKMNGANVLDLTESANNPVGLQMRAQHLTNPDATFTVTQTSDTGGVGGITNIDTANSTIMNFSIGGAGYLSLDSTSPALKATQDLWMINKYIILDDTDQNSGIGSTVDNTLQFFTDGIIRFAIQNTLTTAGTDILHTRIDTVPIYTFFRDDTTTLANDPIGELIFNGRMSDVSTTQQQFAKIRGIAEDVGPTTREGEIRFDVADTLGVGNDSLTTYFRVKAFNLNPDSTRGANISEKPFKTQTIFPNTSADIGYSNSTFSNSFIDNMNSNKIIFTGSTSHTNTETSIGGDATGMWFNNELATDNFEFSEAGSVYLTIGTPTANNYEIFMGTNPFTAGETYRILMGENSNSSAEIKFTEGSDNLILNRLGVATTKGVELQSAGVGKLRTTSTSVDFLTSVNINAQDMTNVVDVKSNGGGGATTGVIGELITANGGFNYFVRDTIAWESNASTEINFGANGIDILTNGTSDDIDLTVSGLTSSVNINATDLCLFNTTASTGFQFFVNGGTRFTVQDNLTVNSVPLSMQTNHIAITEQTAPTNVANQSMLYAKDVSTVTHLFTRDSDGTEHDLSVGAGGSHNLLSATHTDTLVGTVVRGDVIIGNATPAWSRLAKGTANQVLSMNGAGTDVVWADASGGVSNPLTLSDTSVLQFIMDWTTIPIDNTKIGEMIFRSNDSASADHDWASIEVTVLDNTATDAEAKMDLRVSTDTTDSLETFVTLWGDSLSGGHRVITEKPLDINAGITGGFDLLGIGNQTISANAGNIVLQPISTGSVAISINSSDILLALSSQITINRPVSLSANLLSSTGDITPTTTDTYDLGTSLLRYDNIYVQKVIYNTNTQMTGFAGGISIFANDTGDDVLIQANDNVAIQGNASGKLGFFGITTANTKQTITGSTAGNVALQNLLTALASHNLIVDSTT